MRWKWQERINRWNEAKWPTIIQELKGEGRKLKREEEQKSSKETRKQRPDVALCVARARLWITLGDVLMVQYYFRPNDAGKPSIGTRNDNNSVMDKKCMDWWMIIHLSELTSWEKCPIYIPWRLLRPFPPAVKPRASELSFATESPSRFSSLATELFDRWLSSTHVT